MSRRLSLQQLPAFARSLSETDRQVVALVARLRLMSHRQLAALLGDPSSPASAASRAREVRRRLSRLTEQGVLARLERRVGGVRAGSNGYIYYLGPLGQRLVSYWAGDGAIRGRRRPEPSPRYAMHRLAVSGLYVELQIADRQGAVELLAFEAEPDCWRFYVDRFGGKAIIKPDAFTRVGLGHYEDEWFVEVDLGTESLAVIERKARMYFDYYGTGHEQAERQIFPRVLFIANSTARAAAIERACHRLPEESQRLFVVTTIDRALEVLRGSELGSQDPKNNVLLTGQHPHAVGYL
jgi:Replication-relaxation